MVNLSDQEKSILLVKARGGLIALPRIDGGSYLKEALDLGYHATVNLYAPANMALAKRVCLWAYCEMPPFRDYLDKYAIAIMLDDEGFRRLLDKALELAIEAGFIEVDNE